MKMAMLSAALVLLLASGAQAKVFNAKTAKWLDIYTAYPQPVEVQLLDNMTCLSSFALCSYSNCTINFQSTPLIAECGCVPILPTNFPAGNPWNSGPVGNLLDKSVQIASGKVCNSKFDCQLNQNYNTAPFCKAMQPSCESKGKPTMFNGIFDLISSFNPAGWPVGLKENQGVTGPAIKCLDGGYYANCFGAGCINKKSWNGLPTTCYCPVYKMPVGHLFQIFGQTPNNTFAKNCKGINVGGKLKYLQHGI